MTLGQILLVRPPINVERNAPFFLPLGLLCCAAPIRNAGFEVDILDYEYLLRRGDIEALNPVTWIADLCDPIVEKAPAVVGLTALADTMPTCLLMGRYLKGRLPRTTVVIGGPGVFGMIPALGARYSDGFDYLCINEGELALLALARRLAAGEAHPAVLGLWSPHGVAPVATTDAFAEIDELPMPAYDLLPVQDYVEMATPRIFDVYLGTGCTYACKFCVTSTFWNRTFRSKSPATVLAELDYLHDNFGISEVNFLHDNFANSKHYLQSFIDYFTAHNRGYRWGCAVRPDNVTGPQLEAMRAAGCTMIFCGTDSGSPKILKSMAKMTKVDPSYRFFENCRQAGIAFETNAIIGFPEESDTNLEETLDIVFDAVAYGATNSDVSVLQPLPGAQVTKDNSDALTWVGPALGGAFLPPQVLELAERDVDIFTGFAFIRRGNRPFAWYQEVTRLVRYFTRHYFRTVYFLKRRCAISYVSIFEGMAAGGAKTDAGAAFAAVFAGLDLPEDQHALAAAVYAIDRATEAAKGLDVRAEIANIYARAQADATADDHALVSVDYPVHALFEALPRSLGRDLPAQLTTYLIVRSAGDNLVTLRLTGWQARLWTALAEHRAAEAVAGAFADHLVARGIDRPKAEAAVDRAAALFASVLKSGPGAEPDMAEAGST